MSQQLLVAGDIGGTKTDLAIFSREAGPQSPLAEAKFHTDDYASLAVIVKKFLADEGKPVDSACFAVAGPVIEGHVRITNLPWLMEENALAQALGLKPNSVLLINDLEAMARSVPLLRPIDLVTINTGVAVHKGAMAVIAPGTGLGEAFLTWDDGGYHAHSSEGGHSDFAPTDQRQIQLLQYMLKTLNHVSVEHVCSGMGIPNIYRYLRDVEKLAENQNVAAQVEAARDPSFVIIGHAADPEFPGALCAATIDIFISILASEAANLAVKVLATGGVYLAGGVVTHLFSALKSPAFMQSFERKGRLAGLMANIPVHAIVSSAGLTGAAAWGLDNLRG
jgi:glucokinase